ncbi:MULTISPECIES: beta-aspartyl-peptidase [Enterococcus]|uniref:Isoaspartyl dipeptidase n=1 Tax=Enterococcus gallinarum TaxID=1353 RepID=A0ABD4HQY8_ENTGA|nr:MULTISPECIES: beta-aspartyl-peptidase [Enterococcus]MBA0949598.1 beta-aspartyl-peptidase [Enterococcus gallinarum]MBA0962554.1 beta-aspartyl-peptidase [Enterococcus gallinarum]MBA0970490.1 beta-aspartyl-peptidase [Enterococcus gallinarum]MBA0973886.1 beta-aspartyl-peptidase [Enterococcus gallinarum]MCR1932898.1 beta-aspartyl-peptidase [Enterococcus gallinarum]
MKLIRQAEVYAPEYLGKKDILVINDKIVAIEDQISGGFDQLTVEEIDGSSLIATPGFIDCHFHILGGGGEGGYQNRTPEVTLSQLTTAGVTTVVGCLGTDGVGRDMVALISKAKGLEAEGISTYVYDGSYRLPLDPVTGSLIKDFLTIDKVIGIGEIAVSDHRSSQPSFEEFTRAVADARVGGMLSGKAGIINVHLGGGKRQYELLLQTVEETEIPISQFLPTHANRTSELFEASIAFAKMGGTIDFTASEDPDFWEREDDEVRFSKGLKRLLDEGIGLDQFTMTSDGQGSLPYFDENNQFIGLGVGSSRALMVGIKEAVQVEQIPLEIALRAITSNPAKILKLAQKGRIAPGMDADLCLLNQDTLDVETVIAKGKVMVDKKDVKVWGTFEQLV